jgi:hypothetical protein
MGRFMLLAAIWLEIGFHPISSQIAANSMNLPINSSMSSPGTFNRFDGYLFQDSIVL